ncbi:MAG TPA: alpha/beta fold hydrolase [Stellaceae bacterium]|nr:alpha/beta fold hydrolase [Stellaceae bacterium]
MRPATPPLRHAVGLTAGKVAVYYDLLEPAAGPTRPTVVMIHGGAHTGACYLRTVDGRKGWAHLFAARGHRVAVPDWPGIGRSGYVPPEEHTGAAIVQGLGTLLATLPPPLFLVTHSMAGAFGWRLLELHREHIARVVGVAPAPPGNILPEPEMLGETESAVELQAGPLRFRLDKRAPFLCDRAFIDKKIVGDGRFFPRHLVEAYAASLLPIPARLIFERLNVGGSQIRVQQPQALAGKRILVVTGTNDIDHSRAVDGATAQWLGDAGAKPDFIYLGDRGIIGNGHMLMLEENSDDIAAIILDWLAQP